MKYFFQFSLLFTIYVIISTEPSYLKRPVNDFEFIKKINDLNSTWVAGENNKFFNTSLGEAHKLFGAFLFNRIGVLPTKQNFGSLENLPEQYDVRDQWKICQSVNDIQDQANCGSCWAVIAAEVMSDRICITSNGTLQTRVSAKYIVTCSGKNESQGCQGGDPLLAWNLWLKEGIPSGGVFNDTTTCQPYLLPPCDL